MTALNSKVAVTISNMVNFDPSIENSSASGSAALCAALFAIVIWAVAAWRFGIPTSESHALIAGISGAAVALNGGFSGINFAEWCKVLYGLVLSTLLGFAFGWVTVKTVEAAVKTVIKITGSCNRTLANGFFAKAQVVGAAATAFMHGAQDGQKFMGVFMLGMFMSKGSAVSDEFQIPFWLILLCSAFMALGTMIGGDRIIKSVGMDMVKLEKYQGFSADVSASLCLLISSLFGFPVSTTHTKTTAIMGVGAAKRLSSVNWSVVKEMILTWILTFPGCGFIGFFTAKIFILIF